MIRYVRITLAFLLACLTLPQLLTHQALFGDGKEYILQTQSLVFDREIRIDRLKRSEYWNETNPYGSTIESAAVLPQHGVSQRLQDAHFGGLYSDKSGDYRYYHFWLYSAIVAPIYELLHRWSSGTQGEYLSFRIVNVFCLLLPLFAALHRTNSRRFILVTLAVLLSPLPGYIPWQHPELFLFGLTTTSLLLAFTNGSTYLASTLLGIAASQSPPIALYIPLLFLMRPSHRVEELSCAEKRSGPLLSGSPFLRMLLSVILCVTLSLTSSLYYLNYFGVPNLIQSVGMANASYASIERVKHIWFSPLIGGIWYYPGVILFFVLLQLRRQAWRGLLLIPFILAASWLATTTGNFHSAQIGSLRYSVWLVSPLVAYILSADWTKMRSSLFHFSWVLIALFVVKFNIWKIMAGNDTEFRVSSRLFPEIAELYSWTQYCDDPETLVENIAGHELLKKHQFNGVYIWNIGAGESLWVVSKRAFLSTQSFIWNVGETPEVVSCSGSALLRGKKGGGVTWRRKKEVDWLQHPFGGYLVLYVGQNVARSAVESDAQVVVRGEEFGTF